MLISEENLPARAKGASEAYSNTLVLEDCNVINGLVPLIFAKVVLSKILMLAPESINPSTGQFAMVITALGNCGNAPAPNNTSVSGFQESDGLFILLCSRFS